MYKVQNLREVSLKNLTNVLDATKFYVVVLALTVSTSVQSPGSVLPLRSLSGGEMWSLRHPNERDFSGAGNGAENCGRISRRPVRIPDAAFRAFGKRGFRCAAQAEASKNKPFFLKRRRNSCLFETESFL